MPHRREVAVARVLGRLHRCRRVYVHSVEDSMLMPIFYQLRFSFIFLGLPKIGPNRYT